MTQQPKFIRVNKTITLVTASPYGWFYSEGQSVKMLHNLTNNTLAVVIPGEDCHLQIKLSGSSFKKGTTLHKLYAAACEKYGVKNIFA